MQSGPDEPVGVDLWRQPLNNEDRQYFSCAGINIEVEMEVFCSAAIPLQWFAEVDYVRLRRATAVARSLAEQELNGGKVDGPSSGLPSQALAESIARREEDLQRCTLQIYLPLLALILYRTARCTIGPKAEWNSPLAASRWFGRLLDLVRPFGETASEDYDPLLVHFALAVEMGPLPLQNDEVPMERSCFRPAILLWAKCAELILRVLTSRGVRLNGATVRECTTVKQAVGCLRLGAHPSSVVAALCASGNNEVDFLGPFARACVAFHVSPLDAYEQGSDAVIDCTVPEEASRHDDLMAQPMAVVDAPPASGSV